MNNYKHICEICVFHTNNKQHYQRHLTSIRHQDRSNLQNVFIFLCEKCNRKFKGKSGLYHHRPKCSVPEPIVANNQEQTNLILETVVELKTMVEDLKANHKPTIINNNNNINVFLNDNLKNATNFIDMIQRIQMETSTLHPTITSENYVNLIMNMITNEMDKLPPQEKPIFCITNEDENQNILHIRHDNKWHKETELEWTSQIHNYYLNDGDEPAESEKK